MSFMCNVVPGLPRNFYYDEDPQFGSKVIRITITKHCSRELHTELMAGLHSIKFCELDYDLVDHVEKNVDSPQPGKKVL